jgi:hypothetical protein
MTDGRKLLTRDAFREGVFARDKGLCVVCKSVGVETPAVDAHHILERRLWSDGGYYLDNGASLCAPHHMQAEETDISVEDIRAMCGILKPILPEHLYDDYVYDKWGNIVQPNGTRLKGELFYDESVQKVIEHHLRDFVSYVKYPRTYHVSWSPGMHDDDRIHKDMKTFEGEEVVVTEKMDGENTSMYSDYIHARSLDSRHHASRDWIKQFHSTIAHDIPERWRVCVENMYAKHSIAYKQLPSYCLGFSVWNESNECLAWDDTLEWFGLLGITPVPVLYRGIYDEKIIRGLWTDKDWETREGYVIRYAGSFSYQAFRKSVAKFVRPKHVQTVKHWMHGQAIEKNGLA